MQTWKDKWRAFASLRAASADEWFTPGRFAVLLGLFFFLLYPEVLLGGRTFVLRDFGLYSFPIATHWRESFWRGELPLWNPLNNCGIPFLAQWSTLVLYPPALFNMFPPLTWALPVFSFAHLAWGGLGVLFLARRWTGSATAGAVAGVIFAFNGLAINSLVWPHYCVAIGWMPWVVLAAERGLREGGRRVLWAVAAGAMQMLSGMPEIILMTWLFVTGLAGWLLVRGTVPRRLVTLRLTAQVLLISALCVPQLGTFLQLLEESQRSAGYKEDNWAMPGTGLANFLVPLFYTYPSRGGVHFQYFQHLVSSYYAGVALVWLGLLGVFTKRGVRVMGLTIGGVMCLLLALGKDGWLLPLIQDALPVLNVARYPVKFLYLFVLIAVLLAAYGLGGQDCCKPGLGNPGQITCLMLLLLLMAGIVWFAGANPMPRDVPGATLKSALSRAAMLVGTVVLLGCLAVARGVAGGVLLRLGLLVLIWFDLRTHAPPIMPTIPAGTYDRGLVQREAPLRPFPAHGHGRLMAQPQVDFDFYKSLMHDQHQEYLVYRAAYFSNCNLLEDVAKVNGFYSLYLQRYEQVFDRIYWQGLEGARLKDFMGVMQYTDPADKLGWKPRAAYLPLLTGGQRPEFATPAATLAGMLQENFNPTQIVYLPLETRGIVGPATNSGIRIISQRIESHRIEAEVEADKAGLLVLAQCFYPAWKAHVNGRPAPLLPANHAFQAVVVPAGSSRVTVAYVDKRFLAGGGVSLIALSLCLIWMRRMGGRAAEETGKQPPLPATGKES
jgi:hypothetical protein